jgi:hypothetical protein
MDPQKKRRDEILRTQKEPKEKKGSFPIATKENTTNPLDVVMR